MQSIDVMPFLPEDLPEAATLFAQDFSKLMDTASELAPDLSNPGRVSGLLEHIFAQCPGLAGRIDGKLVGYLGWYVVPDFRGTGRLGAYVPEWGHSAISERSTEMLQALYQAASAAWAQAGCQVYAITQLAHNLAERELWFWNGFGLLVIDAIRPMQPLERPSASRLSIRKASISDAEALHRLDLEHRRYYTQPPVQMALREATSTKGFLEFIGMPDNAIWMAWDDSTPAGFIRFDAYEVEAATLLEGDNSAFISGAYVRPEYRNQGAGKAMLDAALDDFSRRGFTRCVLDFESFNPQARSFWLRYFRPVAYSLMRVPETTG